MKRRLTLIKILTFSYFPFIIDHTMWYFIQTEKTRRFGPGQRRMALPRKGQGSYFSNYYLWTLSRCPGEKTFRAAPSAFNIPSQARYNWTYSSNSKWNIYKLKAYGKDNRQWGHPYRRNRSVSQIGAVYFQSQSLHQDSQTAAVWTLNSCTYYLSFLLSNSEWVQVLFEVPFKDLPVIQRVLIKHLS